VARPSPRPRRPHPDPDPRTVDKLDGQTLTVKSREGPVLTIAAGAEFHRRGGGQEERCDIKAGDYVGAASTKGADGKLRALEVLIFPEAMKGTAEASVRGTDRGQHDDQRHGDRNCGRFRRANLKVSYKGANPRCWCRPTYRWSPLVPAMRAS